MEMWKENKIMNRNKKRWKDLLLSIILAVLLVVNALPAALYASNADKTATSEGKNEAVETKEDVLATSETEDTTDLLDNTKEELEEAVSSSGGKSKQTGETLDSVMKYTILGICQEGGTLSFDGQALTDQDNSKMVEAGAVVKVEAVADQQHQIKAVKINGVEESLTDATTYVKDITINDEITIEVEFERIYILTVNYDGTNGTVTTEPSCAGGSVKVTEGKEISVTAVPHNNYRVAEVLKNGKKESLGRTDLEERTANDCTYSDTSVTNMTQDYTYEITFAPNYYQLSVSVKEDSGGNKNGKVSLSYMENSAVEKGEFEYNSKPVVIITPNEDYRIKGICIKNALVPMGVPIDLANDAGYEEKQDHTSTYTFSAFTEDSEVEVEFEKMETVSGAVSDYVEIISESGELKHYTDNAGNTVYLYVKDEKTENGFVEIKPKSSNGQGYDQISLRYEGEETFETWKQTYTLDDSKKINAIRLRTGKGQNAANVLIDQRIIVIIDHQAPEMELKAETANDNGYYNKDFIVDVEAYELEKELFSGIVKVEYQVTCGSALETIKEITTQTGILYEAAPEGVGIDKYSKENNGSYTYQPIIINAEKNNSDYVRLTVTVTDLSGNVAVKTEDYKVNVTIPEIEIEMTGESKPNADNSYYTSRSAAITITDRNSTFDADGIDIQIRAKDVSGDVIVSAEEIRLSEWKTEGTDSNKHTAVLSFQEDANYQWSVCYTNKADKTVESTKEEDQDYVIIGEENVWKFTIDNKAPVESTLTIKENVWSKVTSILNFKKFFNYAVFAQADPKDTISPIKEVMYYKSNDNTMLGAEQLEALYQRTENNPFTTETITVSSDEAFVIYARIMDCAGNACYISSEGVIVDLTKPQVAVVPIEKENEFNYYNKDINVEIEVDEKAYADGEMLDQKFSGIKVVDYAIICDGTETKRENLYTYDPLQPADQNNQKVTWDEDTKLPETFRDTIVVEGKKNNGKDVQVIVTVKDNAGNEYTGQTKLFSINTEAPDCSITFTDQANKLEKGYGWYQNKRTATVVITDREDTFDPQKVQIERTGKNIKGEELELTEPKISWTKDPKDNNRHIASVEFETDAAYNWKISYTNKAGLSFDSNKNEPTEKKAGKVTTKGESVWAFTVDGNDPSGTITVGKNVWDHLLNKLTFGLYHGGKVHVKATAEDQTSPVTIQYYKTSNPVSLSIKELKKQKFNDYKDFSISTQEQFVVYLKITDYAGNEIFLNSDGVIVDKKKSEITLKADAPNENGIYNKDVKIAVKVEEKDSVYAGIKMVEYWVEADGEQTQYCKLYSFDYIRDKEHGDNGGKLTITDWSSGKRVLTEQKGEVPTQKQLLKVWNGNIVVDAKKNNSSKVSVYVRTEDNAGNTETKSTDLDIDITKPKITVSYDNNLDNDGNGYFPKKRTASIEIMERTNHFKAAKANEGIKITAVDAKGQTVDIGKMTGSWTTTEGAFPDEAVHSTEITYDTDANYTFEITYTDEADNKNEKVKTGLSVSPYKFTVDKNAPFGTISSKTAEGRSDSWNKLVNRRTFGIWSNSSIEITAVTEDATSPVSSVEYYKISDVEAMTEKELQEITKWKSFQSLSVNANQQCAIYLKITDKAGNISYISTDGMIVDDTKPRIESIAPEVTITPEQPINGIYSGDVKVDIEVQEPLTQGVYSGLKTVSYRILNMGTETQSGVLYSFDNTAPTRSQLRKEWSGSIIVDSAQNNSNDVVIEIYAEDNALNSFTDSESIKIDITKPTITVSYDNNAPDSEKYYKDARTATVVVNERNFDPKDIVVTITNTDGAIPTISEWTTGAGDGNLDNTPHTATITYADDGDYTFDINYMDLAKNQCDDEDYAAGTANGTEFTIDRTVPTISVSYDNNDAAGSKYFKKNRTATITVKEHNFDVSRVKFTQTAFLDGVQIASPIPTWSSNGDTHTATIFYNTDGDYTFDVTMTDMAGNENGEVGFASNTASREFTVDTKIEKPVISGVENGKAYKGKVVPVIDFSDINYNGYSIELTRTRRGKIDENVKDQFIRDIDVNIQGGNSNNDTFDIVKDNDGIYTLTVKVNDRAGNEEEETVEFTLNRFGSVYEYNPSLLALIEDGGAYVQAVDQDIEITEYNADKLVKNSLDIEVTKDGRPLENIDYSVSQEMNDKVKVGESGWYQYNYKIAADNFKEDGVYKMTVSSKDKTGNTPENTPENTNYDGNAILFRVDSTEPEITSVKGLENAVINGAEAPVEYTVYDTIGLKSVEVQVDGKTIGEKVEDFRQQDGSLDDAKQSDKEDRNNYSGKFTLAESTKPHEIRLVVYDMAGNCTDTSAQDFRSVYDFHRFVTVSTNFFVRWYADQSRFWGSLGVAAVIVAAVLTTILWRRKKVEEE